MTRNITIHLPDLERLLQFIKPYLDHYPGYENKIIQLLGELKQMTDDQKTALLQADAEVKQAVADAGTRVLAKIAELEAKLTAGNTSDPAVDTIIADMKADAVALQGLAPAPVA